MSAGDKWLVNGMHEAIELDGSTRDMLRLSLLAKDWPWQLKPPQEVPRVLCERLASRYHGGD